MTKYEEEGDDSYKRKRRKRRGITRNIRREKLVRKTHKRDPCNISYLN